MIYNLHSFLFGLKLDGINLKDYKFLIYDKNIHKEIEIIIKDIEITSKNLSFIIIDKNNKRIVMPFYRVKKIFNNKNELIFDNS